MLRVSQSGHQQLQGDSFEGFSTLPGNMVACAWVGYCARTMRIWVESG